MESVGEDKTVCFEYPSPIIPENALALSDGEYVSGRGAVPSLRPNGHALGNGA